VHQLVNKTLIVIFAAQKLAFASRRSGYHLRPVCVGFLVEKVAMRQGFSEYILRCSPVKLIPLSLHVHTHSYTRTKNAA
jgi:hypothetical protein